MCVCVCVCLCMCVCDYVGLYWFVCFCLCVTNVCLWVSVYVCVVCEFVYGCVFMCTHMCVCVFCVCLCGLERINMITVCSIYGIKLFKFGELPFNRRKGLGGGC